MDWHPVEWNEQTVGRFWAYYNSRADLRERYFTKVLGRPLVALVGLAWPLRGRQVLDYGCGGGDLLQLLLQQQALATGCDVTPTAVEQVNARLAGQAGFTPARRWQDGRIPFDDASFDLVTCCEVIEHLHPATREAVLREFHRVLRPGGHLLLTVPHDEDLLTLTVCCPECGALFNSYQHLERFGGADLSGLLGAVGFDVCAAAPTDLSLLTGHPWPPARLWSAAYLYNRLKRLLAWQLDRHAPLGGGRLRTLSWGHAGPHLVALGVKQG